MRIVYGALVFSMIGVGAAQATDFSCPKPIVIPDAWDDTNANGTYDPGVDVYDPDVTGYNSAKGGLALSIKPASLLLPITPGGYFQVDFPALNRGVPLSGNDWYQKWISECSPYTLFSADTLMLDSGISDGTTIRAFIDLINQDPTAYWDGTSVISPYAKSPRVATMLAYNLTYPPQSGSSVILAKFLSVFIESVGPSSQLNVRILDATSDVPVPTVPTTWGGLKRRYSN